MADKNVQQTRMDPWYPGQAAFGVPGADVPLGVRTGGGGNVIYVGDPDATYYEAVDANDGTHPLAPKATIQAALSACVDGNGDEVIVYAGNYTLTAGLTMTLDRVRLYAWDYLRGQPSPSVMIQGDDTFDLLTINALQCEVAGIRWANGGAAANNCITVATTDAVVGCYIHDCRFAVGQFGVQVGSAGASAGDVTIEKNTFIQIDTTATDACVYVYSGYRVDVAHNYMYSEEAGTFLVRFRNVSSDGTIIRDNNLVLVEAGGVAILRGGAVTAQYHDNRISGGPTTASAITQQVDGGIYAVENYVSTAVGGALVDATT